MNILIVGTGYVGLVTGACFAEMGHHVICLDIDTLKIKDLQNGKIPFYEPGLEELVQRNVKANRLRFTHSYEDGVAESSVCFLAVPTPSKEDGSCDISYLLAAAGQIAAVMPGYRIIVNKSTVPVGSGKLVQETLQKGLDARRASHSFDIVSNPEFLKEGSAIHDCLRPDRIILGIDNPSIIATMKEIYSSFTVNHDRIHIMDILSAEMTKYAANAMLATRISFMNELSGLCEKVGADIKQVRIGIGSDARIGYHFLYAGIGYGGSCFPKDLKALQATGKDHDYAMPILEAVEHTNQKQKKLLVQKLKDYFQDKGGLQNKTIALWGLSFKPDTDDMREAPSLTIIEELQALGAELKVYDPIAMPTAKKTLKDLKNIHWCESEYEAAANADAIALVTEWKQFRFVDFDLVCQNAKGKGFFDGRNQYKSAEMAAKGFHYFGIGTPTHDTESLTCASER